MPVYTKLFLAFFLAVFLAFHYIVSYSSLKVSTKALLSNVFFLYANLLFYSWSNLKFLPFPIIIGLISYFSGLLLNKADKHKEVIMLSFVAAELLPLIIYRSIGLFSTTSLIIPLGLSFFCLQAVTYTVGVSKGNIDYSQNPLEVLVFVSFFLSISSGPIQRADKLIPQLKSPSPFNYVSAADGFRLIGWGLLQKLVLADNLAIYVQQVRSPGAESYGTALLFSAVLYSFQLYLDFSGYSNIVIGCAMALGLDFGKNFDHPYLSCSIGEFWRRWHISLSSWLRDYVYIPLGGSRAGKARKLINTMITFLISGLWHGAGITWIIWGLYHGLCICIENIIGIAKNTRRNPGRVIITFILVTFGWIIFSANNLTEFMQTIFSFSHIPQELSSVLSGSSTISEILMLSNDFNLSVTFILLFVFIIISICSFEKSGLDMIKVKKPIIRWACYIGLALIIMLFSAENSTEFIYNRF